MNKALIISDTHGLKQEVAQLVKLAKADSVFHCGDFCVDEKNTPFKQMILVRGNNDLRARAVPYERTVNWAGMHIFITHGHHYQVNSTLLNLAYRAKEVEVDLVLFGHTHYPLCLEQDGLIFLNPGSLSSPRGYPVPTYVILHVEEQEEGRLLTCAFYDALKNKKIPSLSKVIRLMT